MNPALPMDSLLKLIGHKTASDNVSFQGIHDLRA
jgi:hypothetical protein